LRIGICPRRLENMNSAKARITARLRAASERGNA
jgi:hypothetical protein